MRIFRILCAALATCLVVQEASFAQIVLVDDFVGQVSATSSQSLPVHRFGLGTNYQEINGGAASVFGVSFAGASFDSLGTPSTWLGGDADAVISMRYLIGGVPQEFDLIQLKVGTSSLGGNATINLVGYSGGAEKPGAFIPNLPITNNPIDPYTLVGALATAFMGVDEVRFDATDDFGIDNIVIEVAQVVPEPATAFLLCLGVAGLLRRRWRS